MLRAFSCTELSQCSDLLLLVFIYSLSCLHICAGGFMTAVSGDLLIAFLTCSVDLCCINNVSHMALLLETKN